MKSIFRFLALGALTASFAAAGFAQDPCADIDTKNALYEKFRGLYSKTLITERQQAVSTAKEYIEKYGSCTDDATKAQITYLSTQYLPPVEKGIRDEQEAASLKTRRDRFSNSVKASNWDEVYAAGKDIIASDPDPKVKLDATIFLGSIGFDEAVKGNDKYNDDTVKYAQDAIKLIESGATSDNFGYGRYAYKTPKFQDGKNNALGWLNYNIAYIKNDRKKDAKGAVPYFYKVSKYESSQKNNPAIYYNIGSTYYAELTRLETERQEKVKAAGNKDTDETKALFAQARGYADRVLDAYSRAYNLAGSDPKAKAAKDSVYAEMKEVYKFRFQGKENALDALIAGTKTKQLPDPTTPVTPVIEVEPVAPATTGTGTATTPVTAPATTAPATTPATTKPAVTKPAATKPAATAKPAAPAKPAAKTAVSKKTNPKR